jgi:hypothetical protein
MTIRYCVTRLLPDRRGFMRVSTFPADTHWHHTTEQIERSIAALRAAQPRMPLHFQITDTHSGDVFTDLHGATKPQHA